MIARGVAGAAGLVGGTVAAATNSQPVDLTGIAAIITAVGGLLTLAWTVYQGTRRKQQLDQDTADLLRQLLKQNAKKADDDPA